MEKTLVLAISLTLVITFIVTIILLLYQKSLSGKNFKNVVVTLIDIDVLTSILGLALFQILGTNNIGVYVSVTIFLILVVHTNILSEYDYPLPGGRKLFNFFTCNAFCCVVFGNIITCLIAFINYKSDFICFLASVFYFALAFTAIDMIQSAMYQRLCGNHVVCMKDENKK